MRVRYAITNVVACALCFKKPQFAGEARGSPRRLLCRSACALGFFIVYCREVRGAIQGPLGVSACACGLNIKIKIKPLQS